MGTERELTPISRVVWSRLARKELLDEEIVAIPATQDSQGRLLAAVDALGRRHLIVRLEPSEPALEDSRSRGLEIATRSMSPVGGEDGRYLDIICLEVAGHEVFDALGGEFAAVLAVGVEAPATAARRLVGKWRRFWHAPNEEGLTREEQIGLFAELWFLAYWLIPALGLGKAVGAWRGPHRARHDFELASASIEAKATTSRSFRRHDINGIEQLMPPDNGRLFLFSMRLAEERGGANSLAGVVGKVRELTAPDDETTRTLETALVAARITEKLLENDSLRIRVIDERLYRVEGDFPRLVPGAFVGSALPAGTGDVAYSIELSGFDQLVVASSPSAFPRLLVT